MLSSASTSIFHNRRVVSWKQFWYCYERVEANSLRIHSLYQETISQEMGRQAVGSSLESLIMKEWKEDQCCEEDQKIMKRKEEQERYLLITALDSWTFHYKAFDRRTVWRMREKDLGLIARPLRSSRINHLMANEKKWICWFGIILLCLAHAFIHVFHWWARHWTLSLRRSSSGS